jgi:Family of unknown function (DUF6065)
MKITAYALNDNPLPLRPASMSRAWMDEISDRHAYRCLPLNIANSHGWEIASPCAFEIAWDGGINLFNLKARALDGFPHFGQFALSHFAYGIVTFQLTYLFRTEPGWNLFATGPTNSPKDGIVPLSGVIETYWLPYPFTMNWRMTRPGKVTFDKGEPICMVFPVAADVLPQVEMDVRNLGDNRELLEQATAWRARRDDFMRRFHNRDPATLKEAWQRYYFVGKMPDGTEAPDSHQNKMKLAAPIDNRGKAVSQEP